MESSTECRVYAMYVCHTILHRYHQTVSSSHCARARPHRHIITQTRRRTYCVGSTEHTYANTSPSVNESNMRGCIASGHMCSDRGPPERAQGNACFQRSIRQPMSGRRHCTDQHVYSRNDLQRGSSSIDSNGISLAVWSPCVPRQSGLA